MKEKSGLYNLSVEDRFRVLFVMAGYAQMAGISLRDFHLVLGVERDWKNIWLPYLGCLWVYRSQHDKRLEE